jgi:hypothetical protein
MDETKFYTDEKTGLLIMTPFAHLYRGSCCGNGCKYCPYDKAYQKPLLRNVVVKTEYNEMARYVNEKYGRNLVIIE